MADPEAICASKIHGGYRDNFEVGQARDYMDERGAERLRRFCLDSRVTEVADNNIDQWHGADYRYVKVRSCDGDVYILRAIMKLQMRGS
jgi:hypothetical protein